MRNITMCLGTNPLSLRILGTGEYVRQEVSHLVDFMDNVEYEREQSIRSDYSDYELAE